VIYVTDDTPDNWLSVPQAVLLVATGDLEKARKLADPLPVTSLPTDPPFDLAQLGTPAAQTIKAILSLPLQIGSAPDPDTNAPKSRYAAAYNRLAEIFRREPARFKGSRTPHGSLSDIDSPERSRLSLDRVYLRHNVTGECVWYDLRVHALDLLQILGLAQRIPANATPNVLGVPVTELAAEVAEIRGSARLGSAAEKSHASKPLRAPWDKARRVALKWLEDEGYPQSGDGHQANLERYIAQHLDERGRSISESAIRRHVREWIREFRESLTA
jgi:hypothetical protein